MPEMKTILPARKVYASTAAGALATIIIWILRDWIGLEVPENVAVAITTVLVFLGGYFTPPAQIDQVVIPQDDRSIA